MKPCLHTALIDGSRSVQRRDVMRNDFAIRIECPGTQAAMLKKSTNKYNWLPHARGSSIRPLGKEPIHVTAMVSNVNHGATLSPAAGFWRRGVDLPPESV